MLSSNDSAMLPYDDSVVLPYNNSAILPSCNSAILPSSDSAIMSLDEPPSPSSSGSSSVELDSSMDTISIVTGCRKRKMFTPRRSSTLNDPNFRGVTVFMENKFIDNEWRLVVRSKFSLSPKRKRKFTAYIDSSDEEEAPVITHAPCPTEEKHCASCSAVKTPLWRDAEDGTPLCNACGIRYKKYKLRCGMCWHIPKKDEFSPRCRSCGSFYQYVSPRR